jgi:hypothetical protein
MSDLATNIDSISRRVRDASNTANTRAFIRDIFTRCASVINTRQEYILENITITATAGRSLFTVETELAGFSRITDVSIYDQSLEEVKPWRNLWKLSRTWFKDTAVTPVAWSAIGRDLIGVYPAPVSDFPLTFTGIRGDFQTSDELEETGLREEDDDIVRELATALILLRQRDLDMIQPTLSRMAGKANIQMSELDDLPRLG